MRKSKLERLIQQIRNFKIVQKRNKDGTHTLYYKKVKLFSGIPEEAQADYLMVETAACFERIAQKYEKYEIERINKCEQLKIEFFDRKQNAA